MPSIKEYNEGLDVLDQAGWHVDYILTHTCPESIARKLVPYIRPGEELLQRYFDRIAADADFTGWYFGHWHMDKNIGKFHCLYNRMIELQ